MRRVTQHKKLALDGVDQVEDAIQEKACLFNKQLFSVSKQAKLSFSKLHPHKFYIIATKDIDFQTSQDLDAAKMTEKIIANTEESVKKQRSKKKRWVNVIFLMINLAIVVGVVAYQFLTAEEPVDIAQLLTSSINWWWILIGLAVFLLGNIFDSARIWLLIKVSTGRSRPFLSYKATATCRFYDSITPLGTGGQPFQIFYLSKRGLPGSIASSVPIAKYLYSQIYFMIFVGLVIILQSAYIVTLHPLVMTFCYVGFTLNLLLVFSILFLSVSKKVGPATAVGILKFLAKLRIVKDYRRTFVKVMHTVREYVAMTRKFVSSFWIALGMLLFTILGLLFGYSIPFVVYCTFMPVDFNIWFTLVTMAVVCDMACSFIPLPGGSGMAELSFFALFATLMTGVPDGVLVWALLLWRIYTYYGYLLQGLVVMFYDFLFGNKKIAPLLNRFKEEDRLKENQEENYKQGG